MDDQSQSHSTPLSRLSRSLCRRNAHAVYLIMNTERPGNSHWSNERWNRRECCEKNGVYASVADPVTLVSPQQIVVKAGHEFVVSTEDKYAEICDDKVLYMDYVSDAHIEFGEARVLIRQLVARKTCPKLLRPESSSTSMMVC
jgi:hypothetical protein